MVRLQFDTLTSSGAVTSKYKRKMPVVIIEYQSLRAKKTWHLFDVLVGEDARGMNAVFPEEVVVYNLDLFDKYRFRYRTGTLSFDTWVELDKDGNKTEEIYGIIIKKTMSYENQIFSTDR